MSDSHGDKAALLHATAIETPELILHLGDHDSDCDAVTERFPEIPLRSVRGNCDWSSHGPDTDEFKLGGKRFFMTHGHIYTVKAGLARILDEAMSRGVDMLIYGHTHIYSFDVVGSLAILNPGSIGMGAKTYAVLEFKNGELECNIKQIETSP